MKRREFLLAAGATLVLPGQAWALGDVSTVDVVEIQLASGTLSRPGAWRTMLYEVARSTSVDTDPDRVVQLPPDDLALFEHPFAVLVGGGAFGPLPPEHLEQLKRYLTYGGFLYIDDTSGLPDSPFALSVRRLLQRMFPTRPLQRLERMHSLYRAFFLIDQPLGRVEGPGYLEGIKLGSIYPIIFGQIDLSGALERSESGRSVRAISERQRREATKLAVNLVLYALTSNYKQDQAHVKALLDEGRL